uniref:NADP-dependent oxidoreductase domain-containing protein n=1 Tax=Trieres chinensis TaxID=1514140 RepID=A0A7S2EX32_TRICV|mmetsp:Transcript_8025/g.17005  ORF Transcript_8025/g.17005 Transcript_8025/m.17005 type:complete len:423 (+) Transcript_8025:258-1526(+)|eukprot:CAMPEP_0183305396 /NCGR_PEP_ID=MMETSP0160_2-20130417/10147_1 /TAXON_ID=2839 ORGANISM="Odontella Sinensis, Strain Grunow 1884" /NCGR_SAMPLE_ID=MMETSP0160_2 /ASSEMBLY_ACC=CAM_ASM_000250 /LENGTH=422 /DNA_ID=CAMNT_0025468585 /DNA_START=219 /DNA_END=1487 /DNA_ORIENTATION=-
MTLRRETKRQRGGAAPVALLAAAACAVPSSSAPPVVAAFGVTKTSTPRSMDQLVLGTVALPRVPCGSDKLLDDAYERGFRRFDLARTYGLGKSEELFGRWHTSSGVDRETLHLVTKGGMGDDKYGDPNRPLCTRESLGGEIEASLEALRTDSADLYMLHRDDLRIPVETFVDWLNELKEDGLIERWGVSNWSLRRIHKAYVYAQQTGKAPPTATSPQLSLAVPSDNAIWPSTHSVSCPSKTGEIDWYGAHGIEVMGWEALAKGFMAVPTLWREHEVHFSTFHGPDAEAGSDEWRMQRIQRAYCTPANYERRKIAAAIAKENGMSLAQVALLYCLSKGDHVSVLVGAERAQHLDEMVALRDYELDQEAVDCLTAASTKPNIVERVAQDLRSWRPELEMDLTYMKQDAGVGEDMGAQSNATVLV